MLAGDQHQHATYDGKYASVTDAINVPKPIQQPRVPIMVGGNGPNVTWRLAARHADELNVDGMTPDEVVEALPTIRARCEEIGRDPATLRSRSTSGRRPWSRPAGRRGSTCWPPTARLGVSRVMGLVRDVGPDGRGARIAGRGRTGGRPRVRLNRAGDRRHRRYGPAPSE